MYPENTDKIAATRMGTGVKSKAGAGIFRKIRTTPPQRGEWRDRANHGIDRAKGQLMLDRLLTDVRIATMDPARAAPYGAVENGAIGIAGGRIGFIGAARNAPAAMETLSLGGRWATPALIDCHTHLVFGGTRAHEFELRQKGATYEDIARAGGGIISTVKATREASLEDLVTSGIARAEKLKRSGVATIEIKSGYGLSVGDEEKMLIAAGEIGRATRMRVKRTLLGLHALPPEYKNDRAGYVRLVVEEMIPAVKLRNLADAVDAFCESIGFTADETRQVFDAAQKAGLRIKLHAEQLSNMNGAMLAAEYGALSADHLEYVDEAGVLAMRQAGMVAVLLPGAFYALKETQRPPVDLFRRHGVPMAVATDLNPGTSPVLSAPLMMNMAATLFGLTPEEALSGMTRNAAKALALDGECGMIKEGLAADIAAWDIEHPAELSYWIAHGGPAALFIGGREEKNDRHQTQRPHDPRTHRA
jgi:imidazolonepropionase